jgi:cytochrome c oxidase subunit III
MATFTSRTGATAQGTEVSTSPRDEPLEMRVRRARLGMLVALIGIVMIFISFSSAYVVRKGLPSFDPRTNSLTNDWLRVRLPSLLLINTGVLLLSSLTMELARRQAARDVVLARVTSISGASVADKNRISWLIITLVLGLSFLAGQLMVWRELAAMGFYVATSPSSSFVYLLTGVHGVHLLGGVLALLFAGAASLLRRPAESQYVTLDVTGWYWHFMAVLWVYIFCLLEFVH